MEITLPAHRATQLEEAELRLTAHKLGEGVVHQSLSSLDAGQLHALGDQDIIKDYIRAFHAYTKEAHFVCMQRAKKNARPAEAERAVKSMRTRGGAETGT
jgi:hypothetical protein